MKINKKQIFYTSLVLILLCLCSSIWAATPEQYQTKQGVDEAGYHYEYVTNDPAQVRLYTLKNGLQVYLSVNQDQPRIQTVITVKAGSKYDPAQTTGLAHYLEHMMFKGTDKLGTLDWEKEKVLLEKISALYEKHLVTQDPKVKKTIYQEIDQLSQEASQYAIPSEYDQLAQGMGAQGTNANTHYERTQYINDIPANVLGKWVNLECERFSKLVLRLFHTELETVYEEYNMYQDRDQVRAYFLLNEALFPKHQYGISVIGKPEHLKNPSMVNIQRYWQTYYVPNNMAICLSGDLNYEATIKLLDQTFGKLKPNQKLPKYKAPLEREFKAPVKKDVYGPSTSQLLMAYRLPSKVRERKYLEIMARILYNGQAGLLDLDLNQAQAVLGAYAGAERLNDYQKLVLEAIPKKDQTLAELEELLLAEIEKVKAGKFENWLIPAIVNDLRLVELRKLDSNQRAYDFSDAFVSGEKWVEHLRFSAELAKVTKKEIVNFAKQYFKNNYAVVYKHQGEAKDLVKIAKPTISPLEINRTEPSKFAKELIAQKEARLSPVFNDFAKEIQQVELKKGVTFNYLKNKNNPLFSLYYVIDLGSKSDQRLALAIQYLNYLGTSKYSPVELKQELYKLGLNLGVFVGEDRSYVYISGLNDSYEKAVALLEHVLHEVQANEAVYQNLVQTILKARYDAKLNQDTILYQAMLSYAKYGKHSPFTDQLSEQELQAMSPESLTKMIKEITHYQHRVFYYGPLEFEVAKKVIAEKHQLPEVLQSYQAVKPYPELDTKTKIYFVNYDMSQVNLLLVNKAEKFSEQLLPGIALYNDFYGAGLSSVVFQEIREAKGLAYNAYSYLTTPPKATEACYLYNFVGTQPDKLDDALQTMLQLLKKMPEAKQKFAGVKEGVLKQLESERITKENIFWTYSQMQDLGLSGDYRARLYQKLQGFEFNEMQKFFQEHIQGKQYAILIMGNKKDIDLKTLGKYGKVTELTLEEIFGY